MTACALGFVNFTKSSGKTTSVLNLAIALASRNQQVLVVDATDDGAISRDVDLFRGTPLPTRENSRMVLTSTAVEGVKIISGLTELLVDDSLSEQNLHSLKNLKAEYDWILIDTSSGNKGCLERILSITDSVIVPVQEEERSFLDLSETLKLLSTERNRRPELILEGLLPVHTQPAGMTTQSREIMDQMDVIREYFPSALMEHFVPYQAGVGAGSRLMSQSQDFEILAGYLAERRQKDATPLVAPSFSNSDELDMAATIFEGTPQTLAPVPESQPPETVSLMTRFVNFWKSLFK